MTVKLKLILLLTTLFLNACTEISLIVVNSMARLQSFQHVRDLSYGQYAKNRLDIYIPQQKKTEAHTYPVVIFVYGGCWGACQSFDKADYVFVGQALSSKNIVVVIADYRSYPEVGFEQTMMDLSNLFKWVNTNIKTYNGNPEQLFLMGHSSGAHLAAMLTTNESYLGVDEHKKIRGFIGLAGAYDFLPFTENYQKVYFAPAEYYQKSQPVNFINGLEPPLLLLYGLADETVYPVNIESMTSTIIESGGQVKAIKYKNINHHTILAALSLPYQSNSLIFSEIIDFVVD